MKELTRREREQLERENTIISKAEKLFCEHGFDKVSMNELAKESEFTKRTIYRYFTSKEDLYYAVAFKGYQQLYNLIRKKVNNGKTGFDKVRISYYCYYEFYNGYPQLVQLINMGGIIKENIKDKETPFLQKFLELDKSIFEMLISMFVEGKFDGSIRADLEISQLALSSIYVVTGFFQMFSFSGNTYTQHYNLNKDQFIKHTIEVLLDSLRQK